MTPSADSLSTCPLCAANGSLFQKIREPIYNQQFNIHKCDLCSLCYTYPVPAPELLTEIYQGEYWLREKKTKSAKSSVGRMVQAFNSARLAAMVRPLARRLQPGDRILEVGCGAGQLALYLHACGFEVEVTDVSLEILTEIFDNHGIKGYCGDIQKIDFTGRLYNAIIFNNVLEHLDAPEQNLQKVYTLLDQKGLVFIEVPNIDSLQFKLFGENWFPLQLPEHLFHFSPRSLERITAKCGLERIWLSTFSPRVSAAGYVASIFSFLRPEQLRRSMSKSLLALYLGFQMLFLPVAYIESLFGKGSAVRVIYQKVKMK